MLARGLQTKQVAGALLNSPINYVKADYETVVPPTRCAES
jgi:hypothetical protein